jgi:hypothetical protein
VAIFGLRSRANERASFRLPLFPLRTVLFPGGALPLKVFEQRYVEMAKRCLKDDRPFGVCLITRGEEVARGNDGDTEFATIGTIARITTCDVPQLGILQLSTRGEGRFQVQRHEQLPDGLFAGDVVPIASEPAIPLPTAYAPLARLLELIATRVGPQGFAQSDYGDASWVGYRLAEVLPLPLSVKQSMLEINDAAIRLDVLQRFLAKQGLL